MIDYSSSLAGVIVAPLLVEEFLWVGFRNPERLVNQLGSLVSSQWRRLAPNFSLAPSRMQTNEALTLL
jgi:hypothetical protein